MVLMYHPEHARVHPCAAEEEEIERMLAQGWCRDPSEFKKVLPVIDEADLQVDAMIAEEKRNDKIKK